MTWKVDIDQPPDPALDSPLGINYERVLLQSLVNAVEQLTESQTEIAQSQTGIACAIDDAGKRIGEALNNIGTEVLGLGQEVGTGGTIERSCGPGLPLVAPFYEIAQALSAIAKALGQPSTKPSAVKR